MKYYILLLITIIHCSFAYDLLDVWLTTTSDSCKVYLTHEVDSLATSWGLNFQSCINAVNANGVTNAPTLVAAGTSSETALCIVRYDSIPNEPNTVAINHITGTGDISEFEIIINKTKFNPAIHDINITLQHELTHALGLNDITDPTALMHFDSSTRTATTITNDEKNGIKNVYEKPKVRVISPHTFKNDTVTIFKSIDTVDIEFEVETPSMLEHNSITPPDLQPVGYFLDKDDGYFQYDAAFDSLGNDIYRFKTNMDSFIEDNNGTDLQKLRSYMKRDGFSIYDNYKSENSPDSTLVFEIKAVPKILELEDMYFLPPSSGKGAVSDTIEVKIAVPEISGSYPAIKLKIDDVYVDQGDIVFEDNLWVYYWDLVDVTSEITGKRFKIEAELFDDPNCKDESGAMIVEAVYAEDFEAFTGVGWSVHFYENPNIIYNGWFLYTDPLEAENTCLMSLTQNSISLQYQIWSPPFVVPDSSDYETILDYSVYFDKTDDNNQSNLYFWVTDASDNLLTDRERLYPIDGEWMHFNHDLSEFYGQTIRFRWETNYGAGGILCEDTTYALDSILVYVTPPDMDLPIIDYITGNQANVDEDMNINLAFNDASGIVSVTADYNIEGESGTITLSSAKNSYTYTGLISARDHVCDGDIKFRVEDEVGNTIISDRYSISWTESGVTQTPSTPSNLIITAENDSTVALTWSIVAGASEYKVYASEDPYGTFILDTLGTFISGTHWQKDIGMNKMFYRITAGNTSKMFFPENNTKPEKVDIEKNLIFIEPKK
jgi:hypothetical protein